MSWKQKRSLPWNRFGYVILIIIKFCELWLWISLTIINALRSYIKYLKECFIRYPNTLRSVKRTRRLCLVFSIHFSVFGYLMKHSSVCLIHYVKPYWVIKWVVIYPINRAIHLLNNWDLDFNNKLCYLPDGEQSVNKGTRRGTLSTPSRCGLMFGIPLGSLACEDETIKSLIT